MSDAVPDTVCLFTRSGCAGCDELRGRIEEAGVPYQEWSAESANGLAMARWYGVERFPTIVRPGRPEILDGAQIERLLSGGTPEPLPGPAGEDRQ